MNKIDLVPSKEAQKLIETRLKEFQQLHDSSGSEWFSELCFCLLTANSRADKSIAIQKELGSTGFINKTQEEICNVIRKHGHRFHNNKAKYIVAARAHLNIKQRILSLNDVFEAREFLVKNIKGLGYKEASHFLRNVGYTNLAIIDRHILRFMINNNLISEISKTITPKKYIEFEKLLVDFRDTEFDKNQISLSKLDLIIWEKMTGSVLK